MNVEFVRFKASDQVELQGWLNDEPGNTAVLHIHGMSGNGYENYFLDTLRSRYAKHGISFFTIDTRGRGIISDFRQNDGWKHAGSCFELFEESVHDIQGAIDYLQTRHKKTIVLQGHSLGCTKVVHYLLNNPGTNVKASILLAPTDMVGWANTDPRHNDYCSKAATLIAKGKGEELVDAQCWSDKTPISAQTYPTICKAGSNADIYGARDGGAFLGRVKIPTLIAYGDQDIGIVEIDGDIEKYRDRLNKIKNANTELAIIPGAAHGFRGFEPALSNAIEKFITKNTYVNQ